MTLDQEAIHDEVRARYAEAALAASARRADSEAQASCCGPDGSVVFGDILYADADRASLPDAAVLARLGCGNPTAVAELREGESVLDLGSGGGIDVILSAKRVGPTGKAYGLAMTDEMLSLPPLIPPPPAKPRVSPESPRGPRRGGRGGAADVVASDELTPTERAERGSYVGC